MPIDLGTYIWYPIDSRNSEFRQRAGERMVEMKKVEFSGGNRILSAKALRWYDGMDQDIYVDADGIYYIGRNPRERMGTLEDLDAAFSQFQDEADAME